MRQWCDQVNGTVHTTTQEVPWTRWQAVEQKRLRPLPAQRPRIFRVQTVQVTKDALFTFRQNRYSVPKEWARHRIRLEIGEQEFGALAGDERLGAWPRTSERGQLFLDPAHYAGRFQGDKRSALEHQFRTLCHHAEVYLNGLAQARGTSLRDQMEHIVQLAETYSADEIGAAMARGIEFGSFGYGALHRILKLRRDAPAALPEAPKAPADTDQARLPQVTIEEREPDYYAQFMARSVRDGRRWCGASLLASATRDRAHAGDCGTVVAVLYV